MKLGTVCRLVLTDAKATHDFHCMDISRVRVIPFSGDL
jgi:hypothetical protein